MHVRLRSSVPKGPYTPKVMADEGALTTREASGVLGVSEGTVRAQVKKGRLVGEKRGRDLFFRRDELVRYAREVQPRRRGGRPSRGR